MRTTLSLPPVHAVRLFALFVVPSNPLPQMLLGIQDLLDTPNPESPAQNEAYNLFIRDKAAYKRRIKQEALKNTSEN